MTEKLAEPERRVLHDRRSARWWDHPRAVTPQSNGGVGRLPRRGPGRHRTPRRRSEPATHTRLITAAGRQ
jgi:hypothetical protein